MALLRPQPKFINNIYNVLRLGHLVTIVSEL